MTRRSARACPANRERSLTWVSRAGQVSDRHGASDTAGLMSSRPAATPAIRLHSNASHAEPNAASWPASSRPRQCGDVDGSTGTTCNGGGGSAFAVRPRSGSNMCGVQSTSRMDIAYIP